MVFDKQLKTHFINLYPLTLAYNEVDTSELELFFQIGMLPDMDR